MPMSPPALVWFSSLFRVTWLGRLGFAGSISAALLMPAGCGSERRSPPSAQESSSEAASLVIRVTSGQAFSLTCVLVERNATIEWRNLTPHAAISVLSTREPYELASPALLAPYNWVGPETTDECARRGGGTCLEPAPYAFWRHTFAQVGVFDYRDSGGALVKSGSTGYGYGLPPGSGSTAATAASGTICVRSSLLGSECAQVCCSQASDCAEGIACIGGRCGGVK